MMPELATPAENAAGDDRAAIDRLRALGVNVEQIALKPLPAGSWTLIEGIVAPIRGKSRRWYAAAALYGRFLSVLNSGGTLDQLVDQFVGGRALAPLVAHAEMRELVLSASLPGALNRWLAVVIRRTKLRRREKVEVATVLVGQFHEGLSAGRTAAQIIQSLGEPRLAGRRFRREMLRRRSWLWHIGRAACRAILLLIAAVIVTAAGLAYRFYAVSAVEPIGMVERLDARASAVPEGERAWPEYAMGLELLEISTPMPRAVFDACIDGPEHLAWAQAGEFLSQNRESVEFFLRGGEKLRLGYIRRDPLNDGWLKKLKFGGVEQMFRKSLRWHAVPLPEFTAFQYVRSLLAGAAHQAAREEDWPRAIRSLAALQGLSRQIWDEGTFDICRLNARVYGDVTTAVLGSLLAGHVDFLSDAELSQIADMLEASAADWKDEFLASSRAFRREYLAQLYSPDGRFTRQGLESFWQLAIGDPQRLSFDPFLQWCWKWGQDQEGWGFQLVGPCLVPLVAGREEMLRKADELDDLYAADLQGPGSPDEVASAYTAELDRLRESRLSQIRYLPLLLENRQWTTSALQGRWKKRTERDALATAVAAERFRRRHELWPQSTSDLVPEFLKSLPIDPYDGKPLRLAIVGDRPAIYSVGLDRIDNTAQHADDDIREIDSRDWQLFAP